MLTPHKTTSNLINIFIISSLFVFSSVGHAGRGGQVEVCRTPVSSIPIMGGLTIGSFNNEDNWKTLTPLGSFSHISLDNFYNVYIKITDNYHHYSKIFNFMVKDNKDWVPALKGNNVPGKISHEQLGEHEYCVMVRRTSSFHAFKELQSTVKTVYSSVEGSPYNLYGTLGGNNGETVARNVVEIIGGHFPFEDGRMNARKLIKTMEAFAFLNVLSKYGNNNLNVNNNPNYAEKKSDE